MNKIQKGLDLCAALSVGTLKLKNIDNNRLIYILCEWLEI